MTKRITVMIKDDLDKKLRLKQSKMIVKESKAISYSSVVNQILRKNLK